MTGIKVGAEAKHVKLLWLMFFLLIYLLQLICIPGLSDSQMIRQPEKQAKF